jgi:hypothetical protein
MLFSMRHSWLGRHRSRLTGGGRRRLSRPWRPAHRWRAGVRGRGRREPRRRHALHRLEGVTRRGGRVLSKLLKRAQRSRLLHEPASWRPTSPGAAVSDVLLDPLARWRGQQAGPCRFAGRQRPVPGAPPPIHVQQGLGLVENPVVFYGLGHELRASPARPELRPTKLRDNWRYRATSPAMADARLRERRRGGAARFPVIRNRQLTGAPS